jgi:hypothetical protein
MSPGTGATVARQDNHELMNVLSRLLAENLNQDGATPERQEIKPYANNQCLTSPRAPAYMPLGAQVLQLNNHQTWITMTLT